MKGFAGIDVDRVDDSVLRHLLQELDAGLREQSALLQRLVVAGGPDDPDPDPDDPEDAGKLSVQHPTVRMPDAMTRRTRAEAVTGAWTFPEPTDLSHPATKNYVDDSIADADIVAFLDGLHPLPQGATDANLNMYGGWKLADASGDDACVGTVLLPKAIGARSVFKLEVVFTVDNATISGDQVRLVFRLAPKNGTLEEDFYSYETLALTVDVHDTNATDRLNTATFNKSASWSYRAATDWIMGWRLYRDDTHADDTYTGAILVYGGRMTWSYT